MIHVIPGFLGESRDFDFLKTHDEVMIHDLRKIDADGIGKLLSANDSLLGYSLGGRVSLEIADRLQFNLRKVILLASHPGLSSEMDRAERKKWEAVVLEKLTGNSKDFFDWWNALPVFTNDLPLSERDLSGWANVFNRYLLSHQRNFLPLIQEHADKIIYLYGEKDNKYAQLAREEIAPLGISCHGIHAGHRIFQNKEAILKILREEIP